MHSVVVLTSWLGGSTLHTRLMLWVSAPSGCDPSCITFTTCTEPGNIPPLPLLFFKIGFGQELNVVCCCVGVALSLLWVWFGLCWVALGLICFAFGLLWVGLLWWAFWLIVICGVGLGGFAFGWLYPKHTQSCSNAIANK